MVAKIQVKVGMDLKTIRRKVKNANVTNLGRAGFFVRREARKSIRKHKQKPIEVEVGGVKRKVKEPSEPGKAPRTTGPLRDSIKFDVSPQKDDVIVGPDAGFVADIGMAHEFGGTFRGNRYPKRPFMGPALEKVRSRLPRLWANSVKS